MDIFTSRYAEAILRFALGLDKGDVLSINTESDNLDFAHDVARLAREITGNGTFIQTIENGKVVSSDEVFSDFPITAKLPDSFLPGSSFSRLTPIQQIQQRRDHTRRTQQQSER